jgi:uncharacterized protein DUF3168
MDFEGALRARLTGLAGGRVYWDDRPQASALPAITLQSITDNRPQHLKGFNDLKDHFVQIDCWGAKKTDAKTLQEAVLAAVVPEDTSNGIRFCRAIVDGAQSGGERAGETFVFRHRIDLIFHWATS